MAMNYAVYVEPEVHANRRALPGHVRQRIRRIIDQFATVPRPLNSRSLAVDDLALPSAVEIRRVRVERWRVVYAVNDTENWVWVLGIYRRPPYDYEDLADLTAKLDD